MDRLASKSRPTGAAGIKLQPYSPMDCWFESSKYPHPVGGGCRRSGKRRAGNCQKDPSARKSQERRKIPRRGKWHRDRSRTSRNGVFFADSSLDERRRLSLCGCQFGLSSVSKKMTWLQDRDTLKLQNQPRQEQTPRQKRFPAPNFRELPNSPHREAFADLMLVRIRNAAFAFLRCGSRFGRASDARISIHPSPAVMPALELPPIAGRSPYCISLRQG